MVESTKKSGETEALRKKKNSSVDPRKFILRSIDILVRKILGVGQEKSVNFKILSLCQPFAKCSETKLTRCKQCEINVV